MPVEYTVLSQEEQDDTIVNFYLAQERDLHALVTSIERYERMLQALPAGKWRDRIQALLEESLERKSEVESIIAATVSQLPPPDRLEAAKQRLQAKAAQ